MTRYCTSCGAQAQPEWAFCGGCGAALPSTTTIPEQTATRPVSSASPPHSPFATTGAPAAHAPSYVAADTTPIPTEPNARLIVSGFLLFGIAAWLGFSFLPEHAPMTNTDALITTADAVLQRSPSRLHRITTWHFGTKAYTGAWLFTLLLGAGGIQQIISGALYRPRLRVWCRTCDREVLANRREWGAWCPHHRGWAKLYKMKILAACLLGFAGALFALVLASTVSLLT